MEMEDRFKIKIPDEEAEKIATVGQAVELRDGEQRLSDGGAAGTGLTRVVSGLSAERRRQVFTHSSWAARREASYERLEFLGDSVLEVVVSEELMRRHPSVDEGELSWMRQVVVARDSCAAAATAADLPALLVAAAPKARREGAIELAQRPTVRAALAEAVIGAGWLDLGAEPTATAVLEAFAPALDAATPGSRDPKTALQELVARRGRAHVSPTRSSTPPARRRTRPSRVACAWATTCSARVPAAPSRRPSRPPPPRPSPASRSAADAEPPQPARVQVVRRVDHPRAGTRGQRGGRPQRIGQEQPRRGRRVGARRAARGTPARGRDGRRPLLGRRQAPRGAVRRGEPGALGRDGRERRSRRGGGQPPADARRRRPLPPQRGLVPPAGRAGGPRVAGRRPRRPRRDPPGPGGGALHQHALRAPGDGRCRRRRGRREAPPAARRAEARAGRRPARPRARPGRRGALAGPGARPPGARRRARRVARRRDRAGPPCRVRGARPRGRSGPS